MVIRVAACLALVFGSAMLAPAGTLLAAGADPNRSPSPPADAFAGTRAGDARTVAGIALCWCPPGRFTMGSPPAEPERRPDEKQVEVTLSRGFWMARYETTQGEWRRIMRKGVMC